MDVKQLLREVEKVASGDVKCKLKRPWRKPVLRKNAVRATRSVES